MVKCLCKTPKQNETLAIEEKKELIRSVWLKQHALGLCNG
jgi:hypothetical protein